MFGRSPLDPYRLITEESKFLLQQSNDQSLNIIVKDFKKNGDIIIFLFERSEGNRKLMYWSKATTKDEIAAAKYYISFDEALMAKKGERETTLFIDETQPEIDHEQNFLSCFPSLK